MIRNGGFEESWGSEGSHRCIVALPDGSTQEREIGNIFTPPGWVSWFYEDPNFAQPEIKDAWSTLDPRRVRSGDKATLLFTFSRCHIAGLMQQVAVGAGAIVSFGVFAHAWSNHKDAGLPDAFPHPDDPLWSEGAGFEVVSWNEDDIPPLNNDPQNDAKGNFCFSVGIDPYGGMNPLASTVEWGPPRYNYNGYLTTSYVNAQAQAQVDTITVFIRSMTLWPYKHNDAYFDDASLVILQEPVIPPVPPPAGRGAPRTQYNRTYVLLPPDAGAEWVGALSGSGAWNKHRFTIGGSADDAGIGDLDYRRIIAINPDGWPGALDAFYDEYYPGVIYIPVECDLSNVADAVLEAIESGTSIPPPPPPPSPLLRNLIGLHVQRPVASPDGWGCVQFVEAAKPSVMKLVGYMEHARLYKEVSPDTLVVYRQFTDYQDYYLWDDLRAAARAFLATFLDSLHTNAEWVDFAEGLNEVALQCGYVNPRFIEFECRFAEALAEEGYPARPLLGGVAVGNPELRPAPDLEIMLPMVRASIDHGGALNYHGYVKAVNGGVDWEDNWLYHAGRAFTSWDTYFVSQGLKPKYILGETGAFYSAAAGWKHDSCLAGDWNAYVELLQEFQRRIAEWNATHEGRCLGGTLFTYLLGDDWEYYNLYGYARQLAEALAL